MSQTPYYDEDGVTIYHGDCREVLGGNLASASFTEGVPGEPDCLSPNVFLTDPPYPGREDLFDTSGLEIVPTLAQTLTGFLFWPANVQPQAHPVVGHVWHKAIPIHPYSTTGNVAGHQYELILGYGNVSSRCEVFREAAIIPNFAAVKSEVTEHPTQKPLRLVRKLIERLPAEGTILDPFMGSGTTLRAAKDLGRRAVGIEIEERYCEIAVQRLAQGVLQFEGGSV